MRSERETSFIGTCVRVSDARAIVDVRMQRHGAALRDVSGSTRLLFPPRGHIELTAAPAGSLHPGDWVAFDVASELSESTSVPRVSVYRRLLPLEDLTDLGSSEAARRLLVEDGRAEGRPGEVVVRIGERELVRLRLAQAQDGRWRAIPSQDLYRLPVWRLDPKRCLMLTAGADRIVLLDPEEPLAQIGTLDWSRDVDFLRRIIASLARIEPGEDQALRLFAEALGRFADGLQRAGSRPQGLDPRTGHEILRLRKLGSMLQAEQDLLAAYYDALRTDPEVQSLLDTHLAALAQETIRSQRAKLVEQLTAELETHFAQRRQEREAELRSSSQQLSDEMVRDLERRRARSIAELEAALAERERDGLATIEATLGARRTELETEILSLEDRKAVLFKQVEVLAQREQDLATAVAALSAKKTEVLENLERLRSERETEIRKSMEDLSARMTADLERRIALRSAEFDAELAERERQGHQALEAALTEKRIALEGAVTRLEDRHVVLDNTIEVLARRERELAASVDGLSFKEASGLEAIELRRAEREAEVRKSIETLSAGMMRDLERRVAAREAELEAELANRERRAREALEDSLGRSRDELDAEVARLEIVRSSLDDRIERLQRRARDLRTSVDGLAAREAIVLAEIEKRRTAREAEVKKSIEDLSAGMIGDLERRLAARTAEFDQSLADREKAARDALESSLGGKRAELHAEVSDLEQRRGVLSKEVEGLQERHRELAASLEELSSREASAVQNVARLSRRMVEDAPSPAHAAPGASVP